MKKLAILWGLLLLAGCGQDSSSSRSEDTDSNPDVGQPDPVQDTRDWKPVAGDATVKFDENLSFLQFVPGIDLSLLPNVARGRELFVADWTMAPGNRELLDGLGPLFIAEACDNCHLPLGRAASLNADGTVAPGLLFRLGNESGEVDPVYGGQLQSQSTVGMPEGTVTWQDTGAAPEFSVTPFNSNLAQGINLGPRLSPQLTGVGLLELVSESSILEWQDIHDENQDGVSGRAHIVTREGVECIGRFGWKAMQCSLRGQSAGALQQDMGLTTPVNPTENCTEQQFICSQQPSGGSPEVSESSLSAINEFLTLLAVPARRVSDQDLFDEGADLFEQVGCHLCHRPTVETAQHQEFSQLSQQTLYAYTDLLLHDMGQGLSDGVKEGDASGSEWRTPPLWGIGLMEGLGQTRFLHDGRAATIQEAIEWHDGEAESSKQKWLSLEESQQQTLLAFLRAI